MLSCYGIHSHSVSGSVGINSSWSLQAFVLFVSLVSSVYIVYASHYLSQTHNCAVDQIL